jgi:hypothetical protein
MCVYVRWLRELVGVVHSPLHHKILTTKVSHTFRPPPLILTLSLSLSLSLALRWLWHFFPLAHIVVVFPGRKLLSLRARTRLSSDMLSVCERGSLRGP